MSRILGIDPGLNITGYGVIESEGVRPRVCEAGVIKPDNQGALANRLKELHDGVLDLLKEYKPDVMAVEQLYAHYKHPRTAILMGHARGGLFVAAATCGIPVVSYSATAIKKTITGHGRAGKDQVQRTIQGEFGLMQLPDPPDVADALAVALCHYVLSRTAG